MKTKLLKKIRKRFVIKQHSWIGYYVFDKKKNKYHYIQNLSFTTLSKELVKILFEFEVSNAIINSHDLKRLDSHNKLKFNSL